MSADLTLPGTIPGLLRKCSPVYVDGRGGGVVVDKPSDKVGWFRVLCDGCEDEPGTEGRSRVHLDLADATGRTHAAWWLASLPQYARVAGPNSDAPRWFRPFTGEQIWHLSSYGCAPFRAEYDEPNPAIVVPSLADLDPNDDRRLPDGSRWVDAEALRRVVLHVAGVPA